MAQTELTDKRLAVVTSILLNPAVWSILTLAILFRVFGVSLNEALEIFIPGFIPVFLYVVAAVVLTKKADIEFTDVRTRPPLLVIACLGALISTLISARIAPGVNFYLTRSLIVLVLTTAITFYWKISFHAIFFSMSVLTMARLLHPAFIMLFIFLPILYWARIVLKKHKLIQLLCGTVITFLVLL
jgi:hypothetical protein